VAVVGASANEVSVGNTVVGNLTKGALEGAVHSVDPKYDLLENASCVSTISGLPEPEGMAVICTPANKVPEIVRQCSDSCMRGLVILSVGFIEAGAAREV